MDSQEIQYVTGDVRRPVGDGQKIIPHCCNNIGAFGAGVALSLANQWPNVKRQYLRWYKSKQAFSLGNVQFVRVEDTILIANLLGQEGIRVKGGTPPVRYGAIRKGLKKVARKALGSGASIHMPKMGSKLAGGSWETIEAIVQDTLVDKGINVFVYDFVPRR